MSLAVIAITQIAVCASWLITLSFGVKTGQKYLNIIPSHAITLAIVSALISAIFTISCTIAYMVNSRVYIPNFPIFQVALFNLLPAIPATALFTCTIVAAYVDYYVMKLPNALVITSWISALLFAFCRCGAVSALLFFFASSLGAMLLMLIIRIAIGAIGMGDIKLVGSLVLILSALNADALPIASLILVIALTFFIVTKTISLRRFSNDAFPAGPLLVTATLATFTIISFGTLGAYVGLLS